MTHLTSSDLDRNSQSASRLLSIPVMPAVHVVFLRVMRVPAAAIEQTGRERVDQVVGGDTERLDLFKVFDIRWAIRESNRRDP